MRPLLFLFCLAATLAAATPPGDAAAAARTRADAIRAALAAALGPAAEPGRAAFLGDYARLAPGDPQRHESFTEAARRILAGGAPAVPPPDVASLEFEKQADALLAQIATLAAAPEPPPPAALAELRLTAHLARFHARRMIAAVHFNLFLRGQRLAELVAATFREKDAVVAWRELLAATAGHPATDVLRADLKRLESSLRDLEEQCCPPDEAVLREPVWQPAGRAAAKP